MVISGVEWYVKVLYVVISGVEWYVEALYSATCVVMSGVEWFVHAVWCYAGVGRPESRLSSF